MSTQDREQRELEQLAAYVAAKREIARLTEARAKELKAARARLPPGPHPPPGPSPGLPRAKMCNPRSYVVQADLAELGRELVPRNLSELEGRSRCYGKGELSPTALCIAAVLSVFRGLRGGRDGCGVQAPLEAWARLCGRSRRQVAYAFAQLEAAGWVARRRRLVRHRWTDELGRTWERADVHGAAYLLPKGAARTAPAAWRKAGRAEVIGLVGKLLRTAGQKLRVLARRVTDALVRCTPSFGEKRDKSFRTRQSGALQGAPRSTSPPGRRADEPPLRLPTLRRSGDEHREDQPRSAAGPQGKGAQALWPEAWERADARGRQWLHRQAVELELGRTLPSPAQRSQKERAARLAWVRRQKSARR